jgi:hypothetical protein
MISLLAFISDARSEALAAEISFIDCTEVIKEYVFACQAIHISVAEAKEKKLTEGLDLEEQKQLVEDEVEWSWLKTSSATTKELSCHTRRRRTRD